MIVKTAHEGKVIIYLRGAGFPACRFLNLADAGWKKVSQNYIEAQNRATIEIAVHVIALTPTLSQEERELFQSSYYGPLALGEGDRA